MANVLENFMRLEYTDKDWALRERALTIERELQQELHDMLKSRSKVLNICSSNETEEKATGAAYGFFTTLHYQSCVRGPLVPLPFGCVPTTAPILLVNGSLTLLSSERLRERFNRYPGRRYLTRECPSPLEFLSPQAKLLILAWHTFAHPALQCMSTRV